jgi:hypothetical protein
MTQDVINRNRDLYIKELNATGLPGVNHIISYLDSHHFFEAHCNGHDRYPGGTANHSLWVLKFAREDRASILKNHPEKNIPEGDLVLTCLLHDVCNCNPRPGVHGRRSREILSQRIKGFTFSHYVLDAVNAHMHSALYKGGPKSTQNSNSTKALLHYLVFDSDHRAIEYGGNIPFGKEPQTIDPNLDIRDKVNPILASNKAGVNYTEIIAYVTRFPQYRPSYILGRKTNGTWDIISVRNLLNINNGDITIRYLTDYEFDQAKGFIIKKDDGTKKKRYPTRLKHTNFFTCFTIK